MNEIHDTERLKQLQALPLERKVGFSCARISEWYARNNGQVYVSFSGGKDSTVLLYLVRKLYPDVPAVFCDTGLEYPELRTFVKTFDNVEFLKPTRTFYDVVFKYGYPVFSKIVSDSVHMARSKPGGYYASKFDPESAVSKMYGGRYCVARHAHLLTAPFKCTALCCKIFKKDTAKKYEQRTGRKPYIGMLAVESMERRRQWITNGCNAFDKSRPTSNPLSFWKTQDILEYAVVKKIPIAPVYGDIVLEKGKYRTTGCETTGCVFCLFGLQRDKKPNRIERLKETHPRLYSYCIRGGFVDPIDGFWKPTKEGLGMKSVIEYIEKHYGASCAKTIRAKKEPVGKLTKSI
jgi:3'-phosphoadenosine 5'-phosphosulfate sulfotransferase (PAPS reductase)/FAD synthetase